MSDVKTVNDKEQETDVLAAANHPEGRMRILGRSGRNYGVYRPGELAWVSPVDLDAAWRVVPAPVEPAWRVVPAPVEPAAEPRKAKAKDD